MKAWKERNTDVPNWQTYAFEKIAASQSVAMTDWAFAPPFRPVDILPIAASPMRVDIVTKGESIVITLTTSQPPQQYGGVCIQIQETGRSRDLSRFREMRIKINSTNKAIVEVKLESGPFGQANEVRLYAAKTGRDPELAKGDNQIVMPLDKAPREILGSVDRICIAMPARGFGPGTTQNTLRITELRFKQ